MADLELIEIQSLFLEAHFILGIYEIPLNYPAKHKCLGNELAAGKCAEKFLGWFSEASALSVDLFCTCVQSGALHVCQ